MKRRFFALALCSIMMVGLVGNASSIDYSTIDNVGAQDSEQEVIQYFQDQVDHDFFGGIYYDDDGTLVVNVVGKPTEIFSGLPTPISDNSSIRYKSVEHSLKELEDVKDSLANYMAQYDIAMLDANEMTNQIDVALYNYTDENMNELYAIVEAISPGIPLNFLDYSNCSLNTTVAYERPNYAESMKVLDLDKESAQSSINIYSGFPIKINGGYYTLGPITSSQRAFTAGHGVGTTATVTSAFNFLDTIGGAFGIYGGNSGDWSRINLSSNTSANGFCSLGNPVMNRSVRMLGAVSGPQSGRILQTNVTIGAPAPVANLTGMCSASYSCQSGDSGAAIMDSNGNYCVGVQSSALFYENGSWAGTSYFTPSEKFYT